MLFFSSLNLPLLCYILGFFDHFPCDLLHVHLLELLFILLDNLVLFVGDSIESPALGLLIKLAIFTSTAQMSLRERTHLFNSLFLEVTRYLFSTLSHILAKFLQVRL